MSTQHVVLTRINVSRGFGHQDGRVVTAAWLDRQLELFEGLALPAMRGQTNQDFTWLLLASAETPEPYRQRMLGYASPTTKVHFIGDYTEAIPGALVAEHLVHGTDWLLSSRIDTDDAVDRHYLQRVRAEAAEPAHEFLNWNRGYVYDLQHRRLFSSTHRSNMFINLVEPLAPGVVPVTTMGVIHTRAAQLVPVREVVEQPRWVQVIHDQNWMTSLGAHRPAVRPLTAEFDAPLLAPGRANIVGEFVRLARWYAARVGSKIRRILQTRRAGG